MRAHTNAWKGKWYLHIRHWEHDRPTKNGVSLHLPDEWNELQKHLTNPELELGKKVFRNLVKENLTRLITESCDGCLHNWPSQTDHECLMNAKIQAEIYMGKAVAEVNVLHFIASLADAACDEKLVLEKPHQTFKRAMQVHLKDIMEDVMKDFDF